MFNLLPAAEKLSMRSEYGRRRLVIVLSFLLGTALLGGLFLAPSFFVAHYRMQELSQTADILQNNIALANKESLSETVAVANKKITTIVKEPQQEFGPLLASVAGAKPGDIKISDISIQWGGTGTVITLKGNAATREGLLNFANILKQNGAYANVNLPISNFAKDSNIDFTLNITVHQ